MPSRGGLWVQIAGDVSDRLLRDLSRLRNKMYQLQIAAARLRKSQGAGEIQLGKDIKRLSEDVDVSSKRMIASMGEVTEASEDMYKRMGLSSKQAAKDVVEARKRMAETGIDGSSDKERKSLELRNRLYEKYKGQLGETVEAEAKAKKSAREMTDQVVSLYKSLAETRSIREGQETLEKFADRIDISKIGVLELHKQLKTTKHGFRELSEEAKQALDIDDAQIDAMTKKFTETENRVASFKESLREFEAVDFTTFKDTKDITQYQNRLKELQSELKRLRKMEHLSSEDIESFDAYEKRILSLQESLKNFDKVGKTFEKGELDAHEYQMSLANLVNEMSRLQKKSKQIGKMTPGEFEKYKDDVASLRREMKRLEGGFATYGVETEELRSNLLELEKAHQTVTARAKEQAKQQTDSQKRTKKRTEAVQELNDVINDLNERKVKIGDQEQLRLFNKSLTSAETKLKNLRGSIPDEAFDAFAFRLSKIRSETQETDNAYDDFMAKLEAFEERDFTLIPEVQVGKVKQDINSLSRPLEDLRKKGLVTEETYGDLGSRISNVSRKFAEQTKKTDSATDAFESFFDIIKSGLRGYSRFSAGLLKQVQLLIMVPGVIALVTAAYAGLATWATKLAADLKENAEKLNMSVQSLQELQATATTTGIAVRDMQEAMEELNTSVFDAIKGKKKAKEAFDELGIEFETLVKRGNDTEEMFELVMQRLDEVDNSAKQLSLAEDIFGEGPASNLINLVGDVEKARNAMKEFEITMSEDMVNSADNLWNKIQGLWLVLKRQFIVAATEASHIVSDFADQLLGLAKQGNVFKGTIVPAMEMTISLFHTLYGAGQLLYQAIYALYQAWDYLLVPIKAIIGLGVAKVFSHIGAAVLQYANNVKLATTWTARLKAATVGLFRMTGYYLIVEAVIKFVQWLQEARRVARQTEMTVKKAFLAIAEEGIESAVNSIINFIPSIEDVFLNAGEKAAESFWDGLRNKIASLAKPGGAWNIFPNIWDVVDFSESWEKGKLELDIASDEATKKLEEFKNKTKAASEEAGKLWERASKKTAKETMDMLKSAEVVEEASQDITDSIEKMAKEGRVEDVEKFLPFAKDELEQKIEDTKEQLRVFREEIQKIQRRPGSLGAVDEEVLRKYQQLQVALKDLKDQYQKTQTDIPLKAQMNKFEENLSNSMERAKLKFKEGSMDLLTYQEQIQKTHVKLYQNILETAKQENASDQLIRQLKNKLLEAQNEVAELESDQIERRYEILEKGAERNIEVVKNELKQREALIKEQVVKGEMNEEVAAVERTKAQERASKEILEIRKNELQKVKDLLGENLQEVKKQYGENSDEVEWFRETIQAKEKADQEHTQSRIDRLNQVKEKIEQVFEREKRFADQRKATAIAGQMEEQMRYTGSGAEEIGQKEEQNLQEQYNAAKKHHERVKQLYDERLQKAKENGLEETRYYKELQLKKKEHQKEANAELIKLQDKLRREQIRQSENTWKQIELGLRNVTENTRTWGEMVVDLTEGLSNKMVDDFNSAWQSWIDGSSSASEAFKSFAMDTLGYINKIIMRQMIMNSLFGSSANGGGLANAIGSGLQSYFGASAGGASEGNIGNISSTLAHSGGIIGKDTGDAVKKISENLMNVAPRLHNGLAPDEYPAVLQKGEGVFTQEQMAAMGGGTEVNIIDKRSGDAPQAEVQESQGRDGRKQIQVLIRDEMKNNMNSGTIDKEMKKNYGIGRKSTRR